jgi:hypothetical protein
LTEEVVISSRKRGLNPDPDARTADIIKGALFSAADEIERKFGQMPRT